MNPVLRENLDVLFGERHVLTIYFYLLIFLAGTEFTALYTQSLGEQMWRGSGSLLESLRVCRRGADRLFRIPGGEPGICAGQFKPLAQWLRDGGRRAVGVVARGRVAFLVVHVACLTLLSAPLVDMGGGHLAHAARRFRRDARVDPFLCPLLRRLGTGSVGLWERETETREFIVRLFHCRRGRRRTGGLSAAQSGRSICLAVLGRQELAPLTIAGVSASADTVHFAFHLVLGGAGLAAHRWALKRALRAWTPLEKPCEARISLLLGWEKRKRRETTLTVALFYAFLAALAVPLFVSLSPRLGLGRSGGDFRGAGAVPACSRGAGATRDTARALAALDRTLRLDQRATTAWELSRRNETKAVALLVLRQANDMLAELRSRGRSFRARGDRHAWLLPPLLALWLAMLYFDTRFDLQGAAPRQSPSLAREAARARARAPAESAERTFAEDAGGRPRAGKDRAARHRRADRRRTIQERAGRRRQKDRGGEDGCRAGAVRQA